MPRRKLQFAQDPNQLRPGAELSEVGPPKITLANSRGVSPTFRAATVLHQSLNASEPLWLMIPMNKDFAKELKSVTLETKNGEVYVIDVTEIE